MGSREGLLIAGIRAETWMASSHSRLLPRGTSRVYLDPHRAELRLGTNPQDRERNNQVIDRNRQRGHLEREFMGETVGGASVTHIHGRATVFDRSRLTVVGQPAGYFENSALIVATEMPQLDPEELLRKQVEHVSTKYPTDHPPATRLAYVAAKMAGLQTAYETASHTQKPIVIEHLTPEVKTDEVKYPRSVPWTHATFGNVDLDTIHPDRKNIQHLDAERGVIGAEFNALLSVYMHAYIQNALQESAFATDIDRVDVRPRSVEPEGYGIVFDITPDQLSHPRNIHFVSRVLDAEHAALQELEETELWQGLPAAIHSSNEILSRKPQPATRAYMHINGEGLLEKVSSNIIYSHAGAIEAAGVVLLRGPQFDRRHDQHDVDAFRQRAGENIESTIGTLGIAVAHV